MTIQIPTIFGLGTWICLWDTKVNYLYFQHGEGNGQSN